MIKHIYTKKAIIETVDVIQKSFITVANDLNLTIKNCPTNPAFINYKKLNNEINNKEITYFGYYKNNVQIGVIAIEKNSDKLYFIERLGVLPKHRHQKIGKKLIDFAINYVKQHDGEKISIGIVNENNILKQWYIQNGFIETGIKKYDHLPFTVCFMELLLK